jgi:hypothetical protein
MNASFHYHIQAGTEPHKATKPRVLLPRHKSAGVYELTTHFHLVPSFKMYGTIPPFPHSPSGMVFEYRDKLIATETKVK